MLEFLKTALFSYKKLYYSILVLIIWIFIGYLITKDANFLQLWIFLLVIYSFLIVFFLILIEFVKHKKPLKNNKWLVLLRRTVNQYKERLISLLHGIKILPLTSSKYVIGLGIFIYAIFLFYLPFYDEIISEDIDSQIAILILNSRLLTTILAITLSISLLGIQYLAQLYTPRSIKEYFTDGFYIGFLITYGISLIINLFSINFPRIFPPSDYLPLSLSLLIFCLMYLIFFPFNVIRNLQPQKTLGKVKEKVPKNLLFNLNRGFWWDDSPNPVREPFVTLELILIQSIKNNDIETYNQAIHFLTSQTIRSIELARKEFIREKNLDSLANRTDDIGSFIFRPYSTISLELFHNRNELMLYVLTNHLKEIIINLHQAYAIRSLRNVYHLYEAIFFKAIREDMFDVADEFLRTIKPIIELEIKAQKRISHRYNPEEIERWSELSEEKKTNRAFDNIMADYFGDQERFLQKAVEKAVDKNLDSIVNILMSLYNETIDKVLDIKDPNTRIWTLRFLLWNLGEAYKYSTENGFHPATFILGLLHYKIKKMNNRKYSMKEQEMVVEKYCEMVLDSVQKFDYGTIMSLGVNGRILIKYPTLLRYFVETLAKGLEALLLCEKQDEIIEDLIIKQLNSVRNWRDHSDKSITDKIDQVMKNYELGILSKRISQKNSFLF